MKQIFLAICGLLILGIDASPHSTSDFALTLNPECAKGQVYWCQDLATAKSCRATRHCIKAVWEKQEYPVDNDSICQICLDMVKEARDQLQSNETQEEMKEVFEGTCELIRVKAIRKQCDKLADDLVPELIEALSSQMNPQVVCSVSGLCNSAAIDRELAAHANEVIIAPAPAHRQQKESNGLTCQQCNKISGLISTKFANTNRDQVLEGMLSACGEMSSLSDGCSAIVLAYFNEVYDHMKSNLNAENICHMAGRCADQFHVHEEDEEKIEVIEDSHLGFVQHGGVDDDIPCDLCKQLIVHLRDLLVANTTESEFKNILEGICKQTKSFKQECLSLADQYYDVIYAKLTQELDPEGACFMIGVCPKGLTGRHQHSFEIAPLVPSSQLLVKKKILGDDEPVFSAQQVQSFQLPKDVLLLNTEQLQANVNQQKKGTQFCTLCEYFLHFAQEALASPVNEENIKESVLKMCSKVKKDFQSECQQFVNMYGDAVIALLIQEIDPSQVCPKLSLCKSITPTTNANEKCPLCLFLVQDIEEKIKGDKSKQNIEDKLHRLCDHLRDDLKAECIDFINTYTGELVDKLASDFTPREICLYLKCCTDKEETRIEKIGDKAAYNDYLTNTIYQIEPEQTSAPECLLCEQLVKQVEKKITKDKSREHIKKVLEQACSELPKAKLKNKCLSAIEKNTDFIIDLLIKEVTPKEVCLALGFCFTSINDDVVEVVPLVATTTSTPPNPVEYICRVCKIVVQKIEDQLNDKSNQQDVENCVKQVCDAMPKRYQPKCRKFIDAYADEIIKYLPNEPPQEICHKACACPTSDEDDIDYLEDDSLPADFDSGFDVTQLESPECVLCEEVIHEVEKKVQNDKSRAHVKEVLEQACSSMPRKDLKQKCDQLVDQYADYIVDSIVNGLSPQAVCHGIGLCASLIQDDGPKIVVSERLMERYSETPQCVLCELIATKLEAQLKDNKTQDEIESAVRKVCRSLPAKFDVKCKKFVEDYADLIIGLLATVPPKELCGELNFCRDNFRKDTSQQDIMECGVCYSAVDALATVLEKHGPKDKEIVVETTCHLLPAKYYAQCHELMNIYGISLTNLIKRNEKRSDICGKIGKCYQDGDNSMFVEIRGGGSQQSHQTIEKPERLFGANKCTYGPGYWCADRQRMEECNAVEFCTKKYNKSP